MKRIPFFLIVPLVFMLFMPSSSIAQAAVPKEAGAAAARGPVSFKDVIAVPDKKSPGARQYLDIQTGKADNSVVLVQYLWNRGEDRVLGTGFAVGTEKPVQYIVTSYRGTDQNDEQIQVCYKAYGKGNGQINLNAKVAAQSRKFGICVLQLDQPVWDLAPVVLNSWSNAGKGEYIYTVSFAERMTANYEDNSPTTILFPSFYDGSVSGVRSDSLGIDDSQVKVYRIKTASVFLNDDTSAPQNHGWPLFNAKGEVIGLNTGTPRRDDVVDAKALAGFLQQSGIPYQQSGFAEEFLPQIIILAAIAAAAILAVLIAAKKIRPLRRPESLMPQDENPVRE